MAYHSFALKKSVVRRRLKAFAIDCFVILAYAGFLLAATLLAARALSVDLQKIDPALGQALGFASLTLPVILYFTLAEYGKHAGTWGKRVCKLRVVSSRFTQASLANLLLRNCVKFLPWQTAHFFVFRLVPFTRAGAEPPEWVLAGLLFSQGLALLYLACLVFTKSNRSLYELISFTRVVSTPSI